jgi:uncharacterized protein YabN with tetrapyrrole methylase and pyrophosphatase domain
MKKVKLDMEEVQKSFDRTDKITAFKKELSQLINRNGIDSLLEVPDYVLASVAVAQMEICSSMASGITNGRFKPVLMS